MYNIYPHALLRIKEEREDISYEMNDRFDNVNLELLTCISSLDPCHSFLAFDKHKLIQLAILYPMEFNDISLLALDDQLENYILDMRNDSNFSNFHQSICW